MRHELSRDAFASGLIQINQNHYVKYIIKTDTYIITRQLDIANDGFP